MTTQLAVSMAPSASLQASLSDPVNPRPPSFTPAGRPPKQASPPRQAHNDGTPDVVFVCIVDWYRWDPKVQSFYECTGVADIMGQKRCHVWIQSI
jgi:hypothetical protein